MNDPNLADTLLAFGVVLTGGGILAIADAAVGWLDRQTGGRR